MALRDSIKPARAARRHGRPKPFGGRFRLPSLRFSGAAMAMSTVVGISLATTWLLNEQQHIGPLPRTSVGASPPEPSPDGSGTLQAAPVVSTSPAPAPSRTVPPNVVGRTQILGKVQHTTPSPTAPASVSTAPAAPPTVPAAPTTPPSPDESSSPTVSPSPRPTSTTPPPRMGTAPTATPRPTPTRTPAPEGDTALSGTAERDQLGSGTRHTLVLTVDEQVTALQVESRLHRPAVLPGTTPWTDVPDAVATVALERDTLVYRFTLPPGHDLPKGKYTFTVTGGTPEQPAPTDPETWTASAFALARPRAVTSRGAFDRPVAARPRASR